MSGRATVIREWTGASIWVMLRLLRIKDQYASAAHLHCTRVESFLYLWLCLCVRKTSLTRRHGVHDLEGSFWITPFARIQRARF